MVVFKLRIHPGFKRFVRHVPVGEMLEMTVPENTTVFDFLTNHAGMNLQAHCLILLNGQQVYQKDPVLKNGDRLTVFPRIAGG
jgi:sulfur carrier protein ThiS